MTAAARVNPAQPLLSEEDGAGALRLACDAASAHAAAVDRDGRFPAEALAVLRAEGLLSALLPRAFGGPGRPLREAAAACYALGGCCSASAMVLAMHHIQVASLAAHAGASPWLAAFLARVGREGLLLASVTSEAGVGGNMRRSLCALQEDGPGRFTVAKQASAISYGAHADALVVTARAHPAAEATDQVLVVVPAAPGVLTRTGGWDGMGMRGTCSEAFALRAAGEAGQVVPAPFARIAAETMVPVSHLLWASLWCGIAADAVARARRFLRGRMRSAGGGAPEGGGHLVRATERLLAAEARVRAALAEHEAAGGQDGSFAGAASINMLKTGVSDACLAAVEDALLVCGFAGYGNGGPFSLSRHLRDLHSARLMIHNDRVRDNTARLLVMQPPAFGIG